MEGKVSKLRLLGLITSSSAMTGFVLKFFYEEISYIPLWILLGLSLVFTLIYFLRD